MSRGTKSFKKKFDEFENGFIELWGEYLRLHDELNAYRGKEIGEHADTINKLIFDIQNTYTQMMPAFTFVVQRQALCLQANHGYERFIEDIKKAGAIEIKDEIH